MDISCCIVQLGSKKDADLRSTSLISEQIVTADGETQGSECSSTLFILR